ncbi:kptA, partial [Symbiodinium microadriaticum]
IRGDQEVKFSHGDLKFLSLLLRGHELEQHGLVFDKGCWTDVDKLLDRFNYCRQRQWGVRQLLRAAKADKKGRIRLLGIDVPMKETIGQDLFPVRVRIAQGHNQRLVSSEEADYLLATTWYSNLDADEAQARSSEFGVTVLSAADTPKKLYHRTTASGLQSILKGGIIPGAKRSGRAHGYFSSYRLNDARYQSGMRSNMPIEIAIDTFKAMASGCEFFTTDSDGTLTRNTVPPDCIISAVDASKKDQPLYVAESTEATITGEPAFRAKRDYEEAASSSSKAPPAAKTMPIKPTAAKSSAPKPTANKMPPTTTTVEEFADVAMDDDKATREGESSAAVDGMLSCLKCKAPQTDESSKVTKKFFENKGLRLRLLATAAAGSRKPVENLISADFRQLNASTKKRGQMSAEATVVRDAKDRVVRANKLNYSSVASRWELDGQFQKRMMQEGRSLEDMHRFDYIAKACLPDPGRNEEQRVLRAGAHFSSRVLCPLRSGAPPHFALDG